VPLGAQHRLVAWYADGVVAVLQAAPRAAQFGVHESDAAQYADAFPWFAMHAHFQAAVALRPGQFEHVVRIGIGLGFFYLEHADVPADIAEVQLDAGLGLFGAVGRQGFTEVARRHGRGIAPAQAL